MSLIDVSHAPYFLLRGLRRKLVRVKRTPCNILMQGLTFLEFAGVDEAHEKICEVGVAPFRV
jgi:hypothetical protein